MKTQSKESVKFATLTLQVLEQWHVQSRLFVKLYLHSHVIFTKLMMSIKKRHRLFGVMRGLEPTSCDDCLKEHGKDQL